MKAVPAPASEHGPQMPDDVRRLVKAIGGKRAPAFRDLCDALGLSPRDTEALITRAAAHSVHVHVEHNHVQIRPNYGTFASRIQRLHLPPLSGDEVKAAVISDTHFGSEHCQRDGLRHFLHTVYDQGIRDVFHPGDFLDGMYRHDAPGSQRYVGIDGQARDALDTLPHLPGLRYHCITGNHDETFTKACGASVGHYLRNFFLGAGRHDIRFYGDRGATLDFHGALVELWHPLSGPSYARSYKLQKHVENMSSVAKPNILLTGHWHTFCHLYTRDVQAIACPTFQGGGGSYGKALGGAPSIGGLVLHWRRNEDGTLRDFGLRYHVIHERHIVYATEAAS